VRAGAPVGRFLLFAGEHTRCVYFF
jgi:hypothetical protein